MTEAPCTAADLLLSRLQAGGVEFLFANAGTDFPSIVEALAHAQEADRKMITPIICPHENAAVSMAHGYAMVTGRPQAVMVHVTVGTANALCGLMNAEREQIPIIMMAGRTPILETGQIGSRTLNIHWAQEMFDQGGMLREVTRWDYELRDARQTASIVDRAVAIAKSAPAGPVYLSLPRELLAEDVDMTEADAPPRLVPAGLGAPDPASIDAAAALLSKSERPLIVTASAGRDRRAVPALAAFADRFGMPVVEYRPRYVNLPGSHPMHWGYEVAPFLEQADMLLVLDCDVPWMPSFGGPNEGVPVIQVGADPLFRRYPVRGFPADVAIAAGVGQTLDALTSEIRTETAAIDDRRARVQARGQELRAAAAEAARKTNNGAISFAWATKCLGQAAGADATFVNEYPMVRSAFDIDRPGAWYGSSPAGGLGWGLPAALGAKLAEPDRLVVAALGDGSHMFANPVVCNQIAAAHDLPILTVVFNNARWGAVERATLGMYPEGKAARANRMPLTSLEPSPAFDQIVEACGGWGARVDDPDALPEVLAKAVAVVTGEQRQAVVDVRVA